LISGIFKKGEDLGRKNGLGVWMLVEFHAPEGGSVTLSRRALRGDDREKPAAARKARVKLAARRRSATTTFPSLKGSIAARLSGRSPGRERQSRPSRLGQRFRRPPAASRGAASWPSPAGSAATSP